jgi:guanine deaminase
MHLSGIREAVYAYSIEDGEPFGLSTAALYAEMAKPPGEQSLKINPMRIPPEGQHPYEMWRDLTA